MVMPAAADGPPTGRVTLIDPMVMVDTRPGKITSAYVGPGVRRVTFAAAAADGVASVRPCASAAAPTDPSVALTPGIPSHLAVVSSEEQCAFSTVPVSMIVLAEGTVAPTPIAGGSQYVAMSTPLELFDSTVSSPLFVPPTSLSLGRPSALPVDATAAVLSLTMLGNEFGYATIKRCGTGSSSLADLAVPTTMPAVVSLPRIGPSDTLCLETYGGPFDLRVELLGWMSPSGPDPTALPPMYALRSGPSQEPGLVPISPDRALDTRSGIGCVDAGGGFTCGVPRKFLAESVYRVDLLDYLSPWTTALSLNVTATGPDADGFLTVWPCGPIPDTSSLNFGRDQTVANLVVASLDADGHLCVRSSATTHVLIDVNGAYDFAFGEPAESVTPSRILDTRNSIGVPGRSPLPADGVVTLQVTGRGGVPVGAAAATLNVTAVSAAAAGFATAWPCDVPRPDASNLNFAAGGTRPNLVTVALSASGTACLYSSASVHLLADVASWFGEGGSTGLVELAPARILDTRNGIGAPVAKLQANGVLTLQVVGRGGVDADADAVLLNVTATRTEAAGFVTIWRCDADRPDASNLNFASGETNPNSVSVKLSAAGTVCLFSDATTDLLVDVAGFTTSTPTEVVMFRLQ
jgi:hypothetical protein